MDSPNFLAEKPREQPAARRRVARWAPAAATVSVIVVGVVVVRSVLKLHQAAEATANLRRVGVALEQYARTYSAWPPADSWAQCLVSTGCATDKLLAYGGGKALPNYHYVLPYCLHGPASRPSAPVIVLFENPAIRGWRGAYVLYSDGCILFRRLNSLECELRNNCSLPDTELRRLLGR